MTAQEQIQEIIKEVKRLNLRKDRAYVELMKKLEGYGVKLKEFKDQYDIPLTDQINALIAEFNRPINRDEENIKQLKKTVNALEKDIKQTMSMCDWKILSEVTVPETINQLKSFVESPNDESELSEINIEYVNTMIQSKVFYSYLLDKVDKDAKIKLGNIIDNIVQQK